jgi:hypothetical protein
MESYCSHPYHIQPTGLPGEKHGREVLKIDFRKRSQVKKDRDLSAHSLETTDWRQQRNALNYTVKFDKLFHLQTYELSVRRALYL